jgi:lipid A 3-O-deacylase
MKKVVFIVILVMNVFCSALHAQERSSYAHMFRFYYDNDFINLAGKGTDNEYTGGMRLDYFYTKNHPPRFFLDRWLPKAGRNAVNTFGWSLMQVAFTPDNIKKAAPDVNDYPYAGGLFAIHSMHSSDPLRRFNIQTEISVGISGPFSYAAETQEGIHRWINYQLPMGWDHQMPTDLLLNFSITGEKLLWQQGKWLEASAGAAIKAGTMEDAATVYGLIRIGKMAPYYDGFLSQNGSPRENKPRRFQVYAVARPGLYLTAYNAFVDGGVFAGKPAYYRQIHGDAVPYATDHNIHPVIDAGLQIVSGKISLSITQKIMPTLLKGYPPHAVGNFSFTVSW